MGLQGDQCPEGKRKSSIRSRQQGTEGDCIDEEEEDELEAKRRNRR